MLYGWTDSIIHTGERGRLARNLSGFSGNWERSAGQTKLALAGGGVDGMWALGSMRPMVGSVALVS